MPGEPVRRDLQAELQAERAAADHWRRTARQTSTALADLRHRPIVRAALAAERRLSPFRRPFEAAIARLRSFGDRAALVIAALGRPAGMDLSGLSASLTSLPAPAPDDRQITLVVVGPHEVSPSPEHRPTEVVLVDPSCDAVAEVRQAIRRTAGELVGIALATSAPIDRSWLTRLAAAVHGDVVAAGPLLVHPARPRAQATPHDGRVRAAGLTIDLTEEGVPVVRSTGAGSPPDPGRPTGEVDAGSPACLLIERRAYDTAGGLPLGDDLEIALVELCARLRAQGGRIVVVPAAVVVDHRPVSSRRELRSPIDPTSRKWRAAIDRSGPALLRSARPLAGRAQRFVLTVAAPSVKVATRWGDWHLAEGLAGGLRRLGNEVRVQTADRADDPAGRGSDVHLVLRGLQPVRRTEGQRHVLWIISHPESIEDEELDAADLVLAASALFADHLRTRTATPIDVLLQATDHRRFFPRPVDPAHRHPVTVVAKTRDVLRPIVADALAVGLRPSIYGSGWAHLVDPRLVVATHVDNEQLPIVYSSSGVVLNDHWRTMQAWDFVSNRLYDVLACGTPVISDPLPSLARLFDGAVLTYHSRAELRRLVDGVLAEPTEARLRADRGRSAVMAAHTVDHRAAELVAALARLA